MIDDTLQCVRAAEANDAAAIAGIYNHYIRHSWATFELTAVSSEDMQRRVDAVCDVNLPWLVVEQDGEVAGYAYAAGWKGRPAYARTVETTIYLAPSVAGRGLGRLLYQSLLKQLGKDGYHSAIGGIALPNPASVALHESLGFEKVAHFRQVGWKMDRWIDVGYWQLMLLPERD